MSKPERGIRKRRIGTKVILDRGEGWDLIDSTLAELRALVVHHAARRGHVIAEDDVHTSVAIDEPDGQSEGKVTVTAVWQPERKRWWKR